MTHAQSSLDEVSSDAIKLLLSFTASLLKTNVSQTALYHILHITTFGSGKDRS